MERGRAHEDFIGNAVQAIRQVGSPSAECYRDAAKANGLQAELEWAILVLDLWVSRSRHSSSHHPADETKESSIQIQEQFAMHALFLCVNMVCSDDFPLIREILLRDRIAWLESLRLTETDPEDLQGQTVSLLRQLFQASGGRMDQQQAHLVTSSTETTARENLIL